MRRLGPPAIGIVGATLLMTLVSGAGTGLLGGLVGVILLGAVVWFAVTVVQRRRRGSDVGWVPVAAVSYQPAAGHLSAAPKAVSMALSRIEARELASSASMGVGVGFCLMVLVLFGQVWAGDHRGGLMGAMELYPIYVHPLAGLVTLAAHRARTRSTREGTQELFDACPTTHATRTAGHLLTAWVPASIALVFLAGMTVLVSDNALSGLAGVGARQVAALLGAVLLCIGATALGVALARWAPWSIVPVVGVIAIGFLSTRLATAGDRRTEPIRQLSTWLNDPAEYVPFTAPHWLAHHTWILALVAIVALLAVARDVRGPVVALLGAVFVVVAGASAVAATRPIDATEAERIASLINDPEAHQQCVDSAGLLICSYGSDDRLRQRIADEVASVVRAVPPSALAGWSVRQDTRLDPSELDAQVERLLRPRSAAEGYIPMERVVNHPAAMEGARFWVALTAVGVTADIEYGEVLRLADQARGVIALWLVTRGVDDDKAMELTSDDRGQHDSSNFVVGYSRPWPDVCYAGPTPVTWALTDLEAARLLLALPEDEVASLLHARWAALTDPATTTAELLEAAGVAPATPRAGSTLAGSEC